MTESSLPRIKVCGLTCAEDVDAAVAAGADALGFVHYAPSPRSIPFARMAVLAQSVPAGVLAVAVLVDPDPQQTRELVGAIAPGGLGAVQLCGSELPADWGGFPVPVLRRVAVAPGAERELDAWRTVAAGFVLDHPRSPGGSGAAVDLERAARLCANAPCLLAGGLDPQNVRARVVGVRPRGVDASSRLEAAPGRKDHALVARFVAEARSALDALEQGRLTR